MSACELPADIIVEILSRSSLQSLGKCRALSKECNSLTYESSFMSLHSQRTETISGYFMQSLERNNYFSTFVSAHDNLDSHCNLSLNFLPTTSIEIMASTSQGILLCSDYKVSHGKAKYYVCKPSTKQWQRIPNPKTRYFTRALGMIVLRLKPLHYKIVRFSWPKWRNSKEYNQYVIMRCEMFDSKTWAWKQLEEVKLPDDGSLEYTPPVAVSGALHWLTAKKNVFAFHVNEERHTEFSLPREVYENDNYDMKVKLSEYEGKLALMYSGREVDLMELWVMEKYSEKLWNKRKTMSIEGLRKEMRYPSPIDFCNVDVALADDYYKVVFYNFRNGNSNIVKLKNCFDRKGLFPFRTDMEPINLTAGGGGGSGGNTPKAIMDLKELDRILKPRGPDWSISPTPTPTMAFLILLFAFTLFCFVFDV